MTTKYMQELIYINVKDLANKILLSTHHTGNCFGSNIWRTRKTSTTCSYNMIEYVSVALSLLNVIDSSECAFITILMWIC